MNWNTSDAIPFQDVDITGGFWLGKQRMIRDITVMAVYDRFVETGRFQALKADWTEGQPNKPHIFWESDVAKWIEGVAYLLAKQRDAHLENLVDESVALMEKYQQPDGYLNVYFTVVEPEARFTRCTDHELYCLGHLIEAAIAYDQATGKKNLLNLVCRYADLVDKVFRVEHSAGFDTPGHEEIELALYRLYGHTGDKRYKTLLEYFIDTRGRSKKDHTYEFANLDYMQAHLPVREQDTAQGHCVRALYLYCAMADLAWENRDERLLAACEALFDNITTKRMYITGGIGSTHVGEAFTYDYHLPEYSAYTETCASIALALFARRMWLMRPHAKYADVAEQAIYNTVLSGVSLSGKQFFYENPLAADPNDHAFRDSRAPGSKERLPLIERPEIFDCSCCPPNLIRFVASIGDFMYSKRGDTVYVHCYMEGSASLQMDGKTFCLAQRTQYPHSGRIDINIEKGSCGSLALRIPGWSINTCVYLNGKGVKGSIDHGYMYIENVVQGDQIVITLDDSVRLVHANGKVREACGRWAVMRGPIVYCAEGHDNPCPLRDIRITADCLWRETGVLIEDEPIPALETTGQITADEVQLYTAGKPAMKQVAVKLIPYYAWANRGKSEMTVWLLQG